MGGAGDTVRGAEAVVLPPILVQVSEKVRLPETKGLTLWRPLVARAPLQAPPAVQVVAWLAVQVSMIGFPATTVDGCAEIATVGGSKCVGFPCISRLLLLSLAIGRVKSCSRIAAVFALTPKIGSSG